MSGASTTMATITATHGRRVTAEAQWPQRPSLSGSSEGWRRAGSASRLMNDPASDMSAGSSVTAASTAVATARAAV